MKHKTILFVLITLLSPVLASAAETAPSTTTKSFGPFQYPVSSGGAQRILPDISVIGNMSGAYYSKDPTGDTGANPEKTGFNFTEIELALQSIIDPYFKGDIFLSFSPDEVEIEEGYITTLSLPKGFQIRAGKFKLPFGRQNQKHPHLWSFVDNSLVNKNFLGNEGLNEIGMEISYLLPTPFFLQLQTTASNGDNDINFGGTDKNDFLYQTRLSTSIDLSKNTTFLLGGSGAWGDNSTGAGKLTSLYGGDILLKWKPTSYRSLSWQMEYFFRKMNTPLATNNDQGFYSYADYQFLKRWHAGLRYDEVGFLSDTINKEYQISPALTFTPTEFSLLRLQYDYDKPTGADPIHAVFLQMQYSMGAHGAHNF